MKRVWLTWEHQIRNVELALAFNAKLCCLADFRASLKGNRLFKYLKLIKKTLQILREERPTTVFCQSPSFILAAVAVLCKKMLKYKVIVDSHNFTLDPNTHKLIRAISVITRYFANANIITNIDMAYTLSIQYAKNIITLPDKLPKIENFNVSKNQHEPIVFYICSFNSDEPYLEVLKAAQTFYNLGIPIQFKIPGNFKKIPNWSQVSKTRSPNVSFLGYLDRKDYDFELRSSTIVVDLTTRESTLLCGAYEAVSVETPLLLSNTKVLQNYFEGAIFTQNDSDSIFYSLEYMIAHLPELKNKMKAIKSRIELRWTIYFEKAKETISFLEGEL